MKNEERMSLIIEPISSPDSIKDFNLPSPEDKSKKEDKRQAKKAEAAKMEEDSSHKSGESSDSTSPPHSPPSDECSNLDAPPMISPSSSSNQIKSERVEVSEIPVSSLNSSEGVEEANGNHSNNGKKRKLPAPIEIPDGESDDEDVKVLIKDVEIREYWEAYEKKLFQQQRDKREEYLMRLKALRHPKKGPMQNPRVEELKKIAKVMVGVEPEGYHEEEAENYHLPSENPSNCKNTRSAIYYAHEDQQLKVPESLPAFKEIEDYIEYGEEKSKEFKAVWDAGLIKSEWQPPQHTIYFLSKRERSMLSPRDKMKKSIPFSPELLDKVAARFAASLKKGNHRAPKEKSGSTQTTPLSSPMNGKTRETPRKLQPKKIKLNLTHPDEQLMKEPTKKIDPIIKHPLWYEEEKFLLKEFYLAFGNDWKEIEGYFLSGKTVDQIQSFFETNRNALLAQSLPKHHPYAKIFKQIRMVSNKMGSERPSIADNSGPNKFSRVDIEVGDFVFVFYKPEPSHGMWIEGQILEQRFKVHMFYHIVITNLSGSQQKYWFSEEDVRLTLPIGTKVWIINDAKKSGVHEEEQNSDESEIEPKIKDETDDKKVLIRLRGNETQVRHLVETRKEILDRQNIKTFSFCNCSRSLRKPENIEPVGEELVFCRTCPLSPITELNLVFLRLQGNKGIFSIPPIKFDDFVDTPPKDIKGNFDTILRAVEDTINFGFYGATNTELAVELARKSTEKQRLDVAALKIGVAKRELLIEIQRHMRNLLIQLCEGQKVPSSVGVCVSKMQRVIGKFHECKELLLSCAEQRFQVFKEVVQEFG